MLPAIQTASIITFCIAAVLILLGLRMFFLKRAPLKLFFQELRAKHDTQYRERLQQQQQADLEAQAAAATSEANNQQTTRLWYGHRVTEVVMGEGPARRYYYYRHHQDPTNETGERGNHSGNEVLLTEREVEFYFPEVEFKNQEKRAIYVSFDTTNTDESCDNGDDDLTTQASVDEKDKNLGTVTTVSTGKTVVACPGTDSEKLGNVDDKMPAKVSSNEQMVETDNTCIICLQEMADMDLTRSMRCCRNVFHGKCILEWFSSYKAACPLCRFDYSTLHDKH